MRRNSSKHLGAALALCLAVGSSAVWSPAWAGDPQQGGSATSGQAPGEMTKEQMDQYMAMTLPGEEHARMNHLVGTWKATIKMYAGPGEPTVSTASATFQWAIGGRYMIGRYTGEFSGMPFEGMGIDGYDRAKKEYFSIWIDNMGTGVMHLTGQAEPGRNVIVYQGTSYDPMQGKEINVREELVTESDTRYSFTMYGDVEGPGGTMTQTKMMEMVAEKQ